MADHRSAVPRRCSSRSVRPREILVRCERQRGRAGYEDSTRPTVGGKRGPHPLTQSSLDEPFCPVVVRSLEEEMRIIQCSEHETALAMYDFAACRSSAAPATTRPLDVKWAKQSPGAKRRWVLRQEGPPFLGRELNSSFPVNLRSADSCSNVAD